MSVDYYMACTICMKALHVAQDGLGGFTFYRGQDDTMRLLGEFLGAHSEGEDHYVRFLPETIIDRDDYEAMDSHGEIYPDDDELPC